MARLDRLSLLKRTDPNPASLHTTVEERVTDQQKATNGCNSEAYQDLLPHSDEDPVPAKSCSDVKVSVYIRKIPAQLQVSDIHTADHQQEYASRNQC